MKLKYFIISSALILAGLSVASCDNDTDYDDTNTNNPSFVPNYNDSTVVAHPESLVGTTWTRGTGIKTNAYGQDIQGYVESLTFETDSFVVVKMSEPSTVATLGDGADSYTWTDDSNTDSTPRYQYNYSSVTGNLDILRSETNERGAVTLSTIFSGVVVNGTLNGQSIDVITLSHFGDVPSQTYLVRQ